MCKCNFGSLSETLSSSGSLQLLHQQGGGGGPARPAQALDQSHPCAGHLVLTSPALQLQNCLGHLVEAGGSTGVAAGFGSAEGGDREATLQCNGAVVRQFPSPSAGGEAGGLPGQRGLHPQAVLQ